MNKSLINVSAFPNHKTNTVDLHVDFDVNAPKSLVLSTIQQTIKSLKILAQNYDEVLAKHKEFPDHASSQSFSDPSLN